MQIRARKRQRERDIFTRKTQISDHTIKKKRERMENNGKDISYEKFD